jgi:hypothetical protein
MWTNSSNDEFDVENDEDEHEDKAVEEAILPPTVRHQPGRKLRRPGSARRIQRYRLCRVVTGRTFEEVVQGASQLVCRGIGKNNKLF